MFKVRNSVFKKQTLNSFQETIPTEPSFIANDGTPIHEHKHLSTPHLHNTDCDRYVSGIDKNRTARFYFTNEQTPIRVYIKYNESLIEQPEGKSFKTNTNDVKLNETKKLAIVNGAKVSLTTLKGAISSKFLDEAKNLVFLNESMSFVPPQAETTHEWRPSTTYAEMAVIPFDDFAEEDHSNKNSLFHHHHHHHHHQSHNMSVKTKPKAK